MNTSLPVERPSSEVEGQSGPLPITAGELASIDERAQTFVHSNFVHVATALKLAREDVPALLAEIRRLKRELAALEERAAPS